MLEAEAEEQTGSSGRAPCGPGGTARASAVSETRSLSTPRGRRGPLEDPPPTADLKLCRLAVIPRSPLPQAAGAQCAPGPRPTSHHRPPAPSQPPPTSPQPRTSQDPAELSSRPRAGHTRRVGAGGCVEKGNDTLSLTSSKSPLVSGFPHCLCLINTGRGRQKREPGLQTLAGF